MFILSLVLVFAPLHLIAWLGIRNERVQMERLLRFAILKVQANNRRLI